MNHETRCTRSPAAWSSVHCTALLAPCPPFLPLMVTPQCIAVRFPGCCCSLHEARRAMLAPNAPPPATPPKTAAAPLPVPAAKAGAQAPAPAVKRPAGRTAAPGGKPQQATGQGARNGIGSFDYMPSQDPVRSVTQSIYAGRR